MQSITPQRNNTDWLSWYNSVTILCSLCLIYSIHVCINECKTMYSSWQLFTADANYCLWIHPLSSWRLTASSSIAVCMWWARLFHGLSPWPTRVHWPPFSAWTPPHVPVQKPARSKCHPRSLPKHARSGCRFLWWPDGVNFITATNENFNFN